MNMTTNRFPVTRPDGLEITKYDLIATYREYMDDYEVEVGELAADGIFDAAEAAALLTEYNHRALQQAADFHQLDVELVIEAVHG